MTSIWKAALEAMRANTLYAAVIPSTLFTIFGNSWACVTALKFSYVFDGAVEMFLSLGEVF